MEIPTRNIIFLQGIFFKDIKTLEDTIIEDRIINNGSSNTTIKLPSSNNIRVTKYKNKKQWSEAYKDSTIKCWYCGLNFKGLPCFIPRHIRNTSFGKEYDSMGLFCGFACAFSFLKNDAESVRDKTYFDKLSMLKLLFIQFYNKRPVELKEAPYVYDLALYGGHLDIMDYRNELKNINKSMVAEAQIIHN